MIHRRNVGISVIIFWRCRVTSRGRKNSWKKNPQKFWNPAWEKADARIPERIPKRIQVDLQSLTERNGNAAFYSRNDRDDVQLQFNSINWLLKKNYNQNGQQDNCNSISPLRFCFTTLLPNCLISTQNVKWTANCLC